jgi:magnesium chelatase family protein
VHAILQSAALVGAQAAPVEVQVDLALGLPGFFLVGLPDAACTEAKVRCGTALRNSGFALPQKRATVNLAPSDLRKEGAAFDLPIALGLLAASGHLKDGALDGVMSIGELTLAGSVLPVRGALPVALLARSIHSRKLLVPQANAREASLAIGAPVIGVTSLRDAVLALEEDRAPQQFVELPGLGTMRAANRLDLSDVRGQATCKRALEVAAAGGHNLLFIGPPGSVEATSIWSVAGKLPAGLLTERPMRAPHHSISVAGLVGGGSPPRPGEISLGHNGVVILDELPEFNRAALEALRQPMEDGVLTVVRAKSAVTLPARCMVIATMNPCPCGRGNDPDPGRCKCGPAIRARYRARISGPILDRFDMHLDAPALGPRDLIGPLDGDSSETVRERVIAAREVQSIRLAKRGVRPMPGEPRCNAQLQGKLLRELCDASEEALAMVAQAIGGLGLSARAHDRILKVSRTIADLEGSPRVERRHVGEAVNFRSLDRSIDPVPPELPPLRPRPAQPSPEPSRPASSNAVPQGDFQ